MDKRSAENIKDFALSSIENLSRGLNVAEKNCGEEDLQKIKKMVGLSIMRIDDILSFISEKFPELDDLQ